MSNINGSLWIIPRAFAKPTATESMIARAPTDIRRRVALRLGD